MIKQLTVVCLLGVSVAADALVKESDRAIVTNEIAAKKSEYTVTEASVAEIKHSLEEKRKERNSKVKRVMKVAKKSKLPAGLFLRTIENGEVVPDLVVEQQENLGKWKKARRAPQELKVPWGNIVGFVILFMIAAFAVFMYQSRKRGRRA